MPKEHRGWNEYMSEAHSEYYRRDEEYVKEGNTKLRKAAFGAGVKIITHHYTGLVGSAYNAYRALSAPAPTDPGESSVHLE